MIDSRNFNLFQALFFFLLLSSHLSAKSMFFYLLSVSWVFFFFFFSLPPSLSQWRYHWYQWNAKEKPNQNHVLDILSSILFCKNKLSSYPQTQRHTYLYFHHFFPSLSSGQLLYILSPSSPHSPGGSTVGSRRFLWISARAEWLLTTILSLPWLTWIK